MRTDMTKESEEKQQETANQQEKEIKEVPIAEVLNNHETRLQSIESLLFRLKYDN